MRPDLIELAGHAVSKGMRAVISTNGTLISPRVADQAHAQQKHTWALPTRWLIRLRPDEPWRGRSGSSAQPGYRPTEPILDPALAYFS